MHENEVRGPVGFRRASPRGSEHVPQRMGRTALKAFDPRRMASSAFNPPQATPPPAIPQPLNHSDGSEKRQRRRASPEPLEIHSSHSSELVRPISKPPSCGFDVKGEAAAAWGFKREPGRRACVGRSARTCRVVGALRGGPLCTRDKIRRRIRSLPAGKRRSEHRNRQAHYGTHPRIGRRRRSACPKRARACRAVARHHTAGGRRPRRLVTVRFFCRNRHARRRRFNRLLGLIKHIAFEIVHASVAHGHIVKTKRFAHRAGFHESSFLAAANASPISRHSSRSVHFGTHLHLCGTILNNPSPHSSHLPVWYGRSTTMHASAWRMRLPGMTRR